MTKISYCVFSDRFLQFFFASLKASVCGWGGLLSVDK